ncbi:MAG TPA: hypothetical protein VF103_12430, partial [Polyangiaceae bacterium]
NLARAYELNSQKRQAVMALETYLEREPNSTEKAQITRRIEALKKSIESEPAPLASTSASASTPAPPPTNQPNQPLPPPERVKSRPVLPLVVTGVGGAVFLLGGLTYLSATSDVNKYASHCDDPEGRTGCPDAEVPKAEDARKKQQTATVVTLVGVPIIAGGLIWYFASPVESASTRVTPAVSQNFLGVSVDGKF